MFGNCCMCKSTDIVSKIKRFSFSDSEPIIISHYNEETDACGIPTPEMTSINTSQVIHSNHVNKDKILDGGQLLKWVDTCACLSAERLAGYPCVTVSVDDLYFKGEVRLGHVINISAQVNRAFTTSMEVGVKVTCEDLQDKLLFSVCEAFITFVALHPNGRKVNLPQVSCRTADEQLVFSLANERRKVRIGYAKTLKLLMDEQPSAHSAKKASMKSGASKKSSICSKNTVSPREVAEPSVRCSKLNISSIDMVDGESTRVESVELVLPPHANHHGNTFGGQIMAWMENVASISASHFCHGVATLRSVDMVYFRASSTVGDRIILQSIVNNVFQNSVEVGVRVEAYRYEVGRIGPRRHINSAFLTYDVQGESARLPGFIPELLEGDRRVMEAIARRKMRLDRRSILSQRFEEAIAVPWNQTNSLYLCYGNVKALSNLSSFTGWRLLSWSNNVALSTRESEHSSFRASLCMKTSLKAARVFNILKDPYLRPTWDPLVLSCEVVQVIGKEDSICHMIMHSVPSGPPKDFLLLISDRRPTSTNEPYLVAIRSVTLDHVPEMDGCSRTEIACAGFVIKQYSGICTEIAYYNETNERAVSDTDTLHCDVLDHLSQFLIKAAIATTAHPQ